MKQKPYRLTIDDCRALAEFSGDGGFTERRTGAIIAVSYGSGLGTPELLALTMADVVNSAAGAMTIRIRGKAKRVVPLPTRAGEVLRTYIVTVERILGANDRIFCTVDGNPIGDSTVRYGLERRGRVLGIPAIVTPRMLRAACAIHLLEGGMRIEAIATLLGIHVHSVMRLTGQIERDSD